MQPRVGLYGAGALTLHLAHKKDASGDSLVFLPSFLPFAPSVLFFSYAMAAAFTLKRGFAFLGTLALVSLLLTAHPRLLGLSRGPSYTRLRRTIAALPQHDLDLPFPEGRDGRYVKFSAEINQLGWNNCLNERLMNAHLAYVSGRAYVFDDYWWAEEHYQFPPAPRGGARTPMPALLAGPVVGDSWGEANASSSSPGPPRSISADWWATVCPPSVRRLISTADPVLGKPALGRDPTGTAVLAHWQALLSTAPERCIEIVRPPPGPDVDGWPQIFDLWLWGSPRILSLWDAFAAAPVSTLFRPSDVVRGAVEANLRAGVFSGNGRTRVSMHMGGGGGGGDDPFGRMLTMHLRRGDYIGHCPNLIEWGAGYYGWAQLPTLPDVAAGRLQNAGSREEKLDMCLPDVAGVVKRIREVQSEFAWALDVVYLLTNESGVFLDELVAALRAAGWSTVVTTRDLRLTVEQRDVSMAVDMEIARRAAAFIGNPWSSFTSNVIHQRLVAGHDPNSIRHS
ncbi:hypothetical protein MKEN_00840200 [Mycena kentingensis (nom. inval.)]|nr:hypothetical protein MKEN_00840200 [Mycena kentingensis (nom. inval.)]